MKQICISLIIFALALAGCNTSKKASSKQKKSGKNKNFTQYQEDLSVLRPSYKDSLLLLNEASIDKEDTIVSASVVPQHDITTKMNNFLAAVAEQKKEDDIILYTIQIYLGADRQTATYMQNKVKSNFADCKVKIFFEPPFYKVRMGEYIDRIEANKELNKAQKVFKNVSLIPMRLKVADL